MILEKKQRSKSKYTNNKAIEDSTQGTQRYVTGYNSKWNYFYKTIIFKGELIIQGSYFYVISKWMVLGNLYKTLMITINKLRCKKSKT